MVAESADMLVAVVCAEGLHLAVEFVFLEEEGQVVEQTSTIEWECGAAYENVVDRRPYPLVFVCAAGAVGAFYAG